jgi:thioredoxin 1
MNYKNLLILFGLATYLLLGCSNNPEKKENSEKKTVNAEAVAQSQVAAVGEIAVSGGTTQLTRELFLKKVWDYNTSPKEWKFLGDKPAVIDFYADWCGPCRIASPILEKVAEEYTGQIDVYKINTDREQELASVFGIQGIPAFLYIPKTGKPVMMSGIARSEEDTKKMFVDNITKYLLPPPTNQ